MVRTGGDDLAGDTGNLLNEEDNMRAAHMHSPNSSAAAQPAEQAGGSRLDHPLVEIEMLSVMKDRGLLTEEEFTAKKARILGI